MNQPADGKSQTHPHLSHPSLLDFLWLRDKIDDEDFASCCEGLANGSKSLFWIRYMMKDQRRLREK